MTSGTVVALDSDCSDLWEESACGASRTFPSLLRNRAPRSLAHQCSPRHDLKSWLKESDKALWRVARKFETATGRDVSQAAWRYYCRASPEGGVGHEYNIRRFVCH